MISQTIAKLYPLANRVVIKKAESAVKSKGGIVLPENSSKARIFRGTVVAVGPGQLNSEGSRVPCSVQVGDDVLLPDYGGTKLEIGEQKDLYVFREPDILAKITE